MNSLIHSDNISVLNKLLSGDTKFDCVYGDCIYESMDFSWSNLCFDLLKEDGVFYIQTDYHTVAEWKLHLDSLFGKEHFINWLIYIQEWGGYSKRAFPKRHDDILMYSKGKNYKFYPDRVQIDKVTKNTKLSPSGRTTKTPMDVFCDLGNFSTLSSERVRDKSGKNIRWQKPQKLFDRILGICTDPGDFILDPFAGSGSVGVWCKNNNRNYLGIENSKEVFDVAFRRIFH